MKCYKFTNPDGTKYAIDKAPWGDYYLFAFYRNETLNCGKIPPKEAREIINIYEKEVCGRERKNNR